MVLRLRSMEAESLSVGLDCQAQVSSAAAPKTRRTGHERSEVMCACSFLGQNVDPQVCFFASAWYSRSIGRCAKLSWSMLKLWIARSFAVVLLSRATHQICFQSAGFRTLGCMENPPA